MRVFLLSFSFTFVCIIHRTALAQIYLESQCTLLLHLPPRVLVRSKAKVNAPSTAPSLVLDGRSCSSRKIPFRRSCVWTDERNEGGGVSSTRRARGSTDREEREEKRGRKKGVGGTHVVSNPSGWKMGSHLVVSNQRRKRERERRGRATRQFQFNPPSLLPLPASIKPKPIYSSTLLLASPRPRALNARPKLSDQGTKTSRSHSPEHLFPSRGHDLALCPPLEHQRFGSRS